MKTVPKILLVSPLPPPVGGIASWSIHVLDFLTKKKTPYKLLHLNSAISVKRITDQNLFTRIVSGIYDFNNQYKRLTKIVHTQQPEVVHVTSSASFGLFKDFLVGKFLKKEKTKSVVHFRFGRIPDIKVKRNWEWAILKRVVILFDEVIVLDINSYKCLIQEGFQNVHVLPNPLSNDVLKVVNCLPTNVERDQRIILFVGHIIKSKGIYELVEAVSAIDSIEELRLVGPYEERTKAELIALGGKNGNRIRFLGTYSMEEILVEMSTCGVFVLPSHTEGFPNVLLEAMASSCPIIATTVGAIPEMLKDEAGISISPKSSSEIKVALEKLINNPDVARSMGKNAKEFVLLHYRIENIINQMESIWVKMLYVEE